MERLSTDDFFFLIRQHRFDPSDPYSIPYIYDLYGKRPEVPMIDAIRYNPPADGWRTFVVMWCTQSLSLFGSALTFFAVNIWLTQALYPRPEQRAELAFALSALSLAGALPMIFGAPLAGAWADRHDRRQTMIWANLASGAVSLVLLALLATHTLTLWPLLLLTALLFTCNSFHSAALNTSYAMLVPEHLLPRANGMMQTMLSLSGILAPGLAAGLIVLPALARQGAVPGAGGALLARLADGTMLAIAADALTFLLAAAVLPKLCIPSPQRTDRRAGVPGQSIWADVRQGARYIRRRGPLLWLLGTVAVYNFVTAPIVVLQPLLVKYHLAGDWAARGFTFEAALALLISAGSIGGVLGGVAISAWGGLRSGRVYGVVVPLMIAGGAQLAFGLSALLPLTLAMAFIFEAMNPILNAHSQAIWQRQTPRELQGRVFAVAG